MRALGDEVDDRFGDAWRVGKALSLIAVSREAEAALAALVPPDTEVAADTPPDSPISDLTPRERDILRLVAAGHANRAIAATLFISPATVKRHVTNILAKLGLPTRAAAVRYAHRNGLTDG